MSYAHMSLQELKEKIISGETDAKKIWEYFSDRTKKYNGELGAFNHVNTAGFRESSDVLMGLPLGVKDIFCETGIPTTGASKMLENYIPPYNASVIEKLNNSGMSSLGKCNMDEFAMGSSTENSAFKNTLNPHGTDRIPGGSSGGSASAVAAGLVPASLGTDTGGSIRQPASMCGVVGFKPSYGRNSRFGIMPMSSSLDCPGTFTKTVQDAAFLYELMNGEDPKDSTSIPGKDTLPDEIWSKSDLKGKKVGIPKEYFEEGLDSGVRKEIEKSIEVMKELGAEIVDISLPLTKYALAAYYIICPAEVSTNLARLDGIRYGHNSELPNENLEEIYHHNRGEGLGDEPKRRSILGSYVLSAGFYDAYYKKAASVRTKIIEEFTGAFNEVDAIVSPVSPSVAWKIGEKTEDPLKMYLADSYTIPASLAGIPGISLPCGFAQSEDSEKEMLPVGLQILTKRKNEAELFEMAHVLEQKLNLRESMIPKGFE